MITIIIHVITKRFQILILSKCCWIIHNSLSVNKSGCQKVKSCLWNLLQNMVYCTRCWHLSCHATNSFCCWTDPTFKKEMFLNDRIQASNDIVCFCKVNDCCCHSALWRSMFWHSVCFVFEEKKGERKEWTPHSFSLMEALRGQSSVP